MSPGFRSCRAVGTTWVSSSASRRRNLVPCQRVEPRVVPRYASSPDSEPRPAGRHSRVSPRGNNGSGTSTGSVGFLPREATGLLPRRCWGKERHPIITIKSDHYLALDAFPSDHHEQLYQNTDFIMNIRRYNNALMQAIFVLNLGFCARFLGFLPIKKLLGATEMRTHERKE